jgi:hypothetical protein
MNTRISGVLLAVALATGAVSCGPGEPPPKVAEVKTPQWGDVFDGTPELFVVVRPQALKKDPVFGNFVKALFRVAESRSEMNSVTLLQAADGAEEVIVGLSRKGEQPDDMAIVVRGVPASMDPEKMNDPSGHPLFHLRDARAKVHELESLDRTHAITTSLFVLPDRTWVAASGAARDRARQAFASPFGRPSPKSDPDALVSMRLDAATFLGRFERAPTLGPLVKKLRAATLELHPGKQGFAVALQYTDDDAAAWGEMQTKRLIDDIKNQPPAEDRGRRRGMRMDWLKDAKVSREATTVKLRVDLPAPLLEQLPNAGPNDIPL